MWFVVSIPNQFNFVRNQIQRAFKTGFEVRKWLNVEIKKVVLLFTINSAKNEGKQLLFKKSYPTPKRSIKKSRETII